MEAKPIYLISLRVHSNETRLTEATYIGQKKIKLLTRIYNVVIKKYQETALNQDFCLLVADTRPPIVKAQKVPLDSLCGVRIKEIDPAAHRNNIENALIRIRQCVEKVFHALHHADQEELYNDKALQKQTLRSVLSKKDPLYEDLVKEYTDIITEPVVKTYGGKLKKNRFTRSLPSLPTRRPSFKESDFRDKRGIDISDDDGHRGYFKTPEEDLSYQPPYAMGKTVTPPVSGDHVTLFEEHY